MALFSDVRAIIQRLAPRGWAPVLLDHGVDLTAVNLEAELRRILTGITRTRPGFEDFSKDGKAAIVPGRLAQSLLYHALASPNVLPRPQGPATAEDFPTIAELDTLENYIFSLAKPKLSDFTNPVIAVVAYHYRAGSRSPHRLHADMAFSQFTYVERHRNEKLRKIHEAPHLGPNQRLPLLPGFDRNASPFVRTSAELVRLQPAGASTLAVPIERPSLVRLARQFRSTTG